MNFQNQAFLIDISYLSFTNLLSNAFALEILQVDYKFCRLHLDSIQKSIGKFQIANHACLFQYVIVHPATFVSPSKLNLQNCFNLYSSSISMPDARNTSKLIISIL